jgi:hypothetical protein
MATIIASHMSRTLVADAAQVWPRIRIHIMDSSSRRAFPFQSTSSGRNKPSQPRSQ